MSSDHQMIRGHDDDSYNLAVGEAFFLEDSLYWAHNIEAGHMGPFYYPLATGNKELLEELQFLYPGKHIIVTNGGKQAIAAALYAFRKVYKGYSTAYHAAPYWPSYPTLIKASKLAVEESGEFRDNYAPLKLSTLINNPSGSLAQEDCDMLDCAYAHEVYGWNGTMPQHKVSVWSAAKLFGLAGLRIGWLTTEDPLIASQAEFYMEITTSGVSVASQAYLTKVLKYQREHIDEAVNSYVDGHKILVQNGDAFNDLITPYCSNVQGVPNDGQGMFAWFNVLPEQQKRFDEALKTANVKLVTGDACGEKEKGWYRMSMGHRVDFTQEVLGKLSKEMGKQ